MLLQDLLKTCHMFTPQLACIQVSLNFRELKLIGEMREECIVYIWLLHFEVLPLTRNQGLDFF